MTDLFNLEQKKIVDIKNRETLSLYAKIENLNIQKTVNNTDFMNLTLVDETGVVYAKKWNVTELDKSQFKIGQLVYVTGVGNEFNNKIQLIIESMRLVDESDDVDLSIFYPKAPISVEDLRIKLNAYIKEIKNPVLHKITHHLFSKYEEQFLIYPAASKNHHAYISGLGHHVVSMLDIAKSLHIIYNNFNKDLLYAGIILHDIGKIIELSDYLAPEYTKVGKLIGHINICFEEIRVVANTFKIESEEVLLLQHMILSHHGLLEYGSPKTPMIYEAELLHLIDLMDSRINIISDELTMTQNDEFTKRIYPLEGRSFYKHQL